MFKKLLIAFLMFSFFQPVDGWAANKSKRKSRRAKAVSTFKSTSSGEVKLESRFFEDDNKTITEDTQLSLFSRLNIKTLHHKRWREYFRFTARADKYDPSRAIFVVEEAYTKYQNGGFEFSLGSQMLNWSATEAFHPADIVNSRNFDSNFENAEKMGEPMVMLAYTGEDAKFSVFYMPMIIKPMLPQYTNRLSLSAGFPVAEPIFVNKDGEIIETEYSPQFGARLEYTFSDADVSLHFIDHIDRTTPFIILTPSTVIPVYLPVQQVGGTFQMVMDSWVFKLEAAQRSYKENVNPTYGSLDVPDHSVVALGLEYGWSSVRGSDTAIILEGQSLLGTTKEERALINIFQQDLLLGYRYAFNDVRGQEIFISTIFDLERDAEILYNLSYQRRITSRWKLNTGLRVIDAKPKEAIPVGLERIDGANQVFFEFTRFF
ncbi:MAG: hypothetical protein KDD40_03140 [Bdellovibrionales bacterium]|nr:hypothetical protein [Bdellovibrionales bacterium]